ncbi:MAG: hypothetical protein AAGH15_11050 [Myxococcota bacterium]
MAFLWDVVVSERPARERLAMARWILIVAPGTEVALQLEWAAADAPRAPTLDSLEDEDRELVEAVLVGALTEDPHPREWWQPADVALAERWLADVRVSLEAAA